MSSYQLKEGEHLRKCYASNQRELEFYEAWRRENPLAKWEPEFFVDEGKIGHSVRFWFRCRNLIVLTLASRKSVV